MINIGSGGDVSINELAELIFFVLDKKPSIIEEKERIRPPRSEIQRLLCNYSLAQELIGWEPSYTLEEGLRKTVKWMEKHLADYKAEIYNV